MASTTSKAATWCTPLLCAAALLASAFPAPAHASDFSGLAPVDARPYGVVLEGLDSFEQPADAPYAGWMAPGVFAAVYDDRMELFVRSVEEGVRFGYPPVCHVTVPRAHDGKPLKDPMTLAFLVLEDDTARYCEGHEVMQFALETTEREIRLPVLLPDEPDFLGRVVKFGRQTPLTFDPARGYRLAIEASWDIDYCRFELGDTLEELSARLVSRWDAIAECAYVNYASGISTAFVPEFEIPGDDPDMRGALAEVVSEAGEKDALAEGYVNDRLYRQRFADRLVFFGLYDPNDRPALYPEDEGVEIFDIASEEGADFPDDIPVDEAGDMAADEQYFEPYDDPMDNLAVCKLTVTFDQLTVPITPETDFASLMDRLMPYCWGSSERRKIMYNHAQGLKGSH